MALVAIVGRPNVGKSTLFNRIIKKNQAMVADFPGVTRDRMYGEATWDDRNFTVIDTAGFVSRQGTSIEEQTRDQVLLALDEADIILFVADGKAGLNPEDGEIVNLLRRTAKPVFYAVNKIDGVEQKRHLSEFYELGLEHLYPISSAHGYGLDDLLDDIISEMPGIPMESQDSEEVDAIRVSIVGRPNVGKSTLVNRILGSPRVIVSPVPGTTRDAVDSPFEHKGQRYVLIDTAGIRRKGKTREHLEKISIIKALQAIDRSHVAVLLLDAEEGLTDQDLHISGYIQERHRACIIGVNKWDLVEKDKRRAKNLMEDVKTRFRFFPFAPILNISAAEGTRTSKILPTIREVFSQYNRRIGTGVVNRALEQSLEQHEPPMVKGRRLKFFYATQVSVRPPTFVLFCNYPDSVHFSYERFLVNQFREAFGMDKVPIRLVFKQRQRRETPV